MFSQRRGVARQAKKTGEARIAIKPKASPFRFGFLVHDVSRMRRTLFDIQMKPLGITRSQWSVLAALSRNGTGSMMQVDLARQLDVGKVTVGGLLNRLEATGLILRVPDDTDKRARQVSITEKGFDLIRQMETIGTANNNNTVAGVSAEDMRITVETLAKVKANIRAQLNGGKSGTKAKRS